MKEGDIVYYIAKAGKPKTWELVIVRGVVCFVENKLVITKHSEVEFFGSNALAKAHVYALARDIHMFTKSVYYSEEDLTGWGVWEAIKEGVVKKAQ